MIDEQQSWQRKLLKTIEVNYCKSHNYDGVISWIKEIIYYDSENLSKYNINSIVSISRKLNIDCHFYLESELNLGYSFQRSGSERLAEICRVLGADTYLSGDGAEEYENTNAYVRKGIAIEKSGFREPAYDQAGSDTFVQGLSVIDALFNNDPENIKNMLIGVGDY